MGSTRACLVSFTDPEGVIHSVEVSASLYEAAGLALAAFRREGWSEFGSASRLHVEVKQPAVGHEIAVRKATGCMARRVRPSA
jgi:hypothetical protein